MLELRRPAVAGRFYSDDPALLRREVARYVRGAGVEAGADRVAVLMAPHAGYLYSGATAGFAYARAAGKRPTRVVLLGRSHRYAFDGAQVFARGGFATPLGTMPIDEAFAAEFVRRIETDGDEAHYPEHGLEVQLPFLQVIFGDVPIVPILFGSDPEPWHAQVGETLASMIAREDLVVISTDLSHYLREEEANAIDRNSLECVLSQDWKALAAGNASGACSMCGATAVVCGMACALAAGAAEWRLLDYRTSGRASGDFGRVVGYGAIAMERAA